MGKVEPEQQIVGESTLMWAKKQVLVYFMDDDGNMRDQVLRIANSWMPYSGIKFVRTFDQNASDIRVSFRTNGWWSYIGTGSTEIDKKDVTLSLDRLFQHDNAKIKTVILHEFGHALGLLHEHQNPFNNIKWRLSKLYEYYKNTYQVDSAWVKENVLEKYESLTGIYCEADLKSIMMYMIPPELTEDSLTVPEPLDLSILDKKYIQMIYEKKHCQ